MPVSAGDIWVENIILLYHDPPVRFADFELLTFPGFPFQLIESTQSTLDDLTVGTHYCSDRRRGAPAYWFTTVSKSQQSILWRGKHTTLQYYPTIRMFPLLQDALLITGTLVVWRWRLWRRPCWSLLRNPLVLNRT